LLSFSTLEFGLCGIQRAQAFLPFAFEAARHQPIVGVDSAIAALGALRFVTGPLDAEPPLLQSGLAIAFEPLGGGKGGGKPGRFQGGDEGRGDGGIDLDAADVEAIGAAAFDKNLAGAMVPGGGVAAAIVGVQTAAAMAAAGEPLQQSSALAHSAACLVRTGPGVASEALLVCLIGLPIDKTLMMLRDQHLPFGAR